MRGITRAAVIHAIWVGGVAAANAGTLVARAHSPIVGEVEVVTVRAEDTLMDLARRFDLGFDQIVAANPDVDPWLPPDGARIRLPARYILPKVPHVGIVVNVAAMRLFYFPPPASRDEVVITYPIAIGRDDWPTPVGVTAVIAKHRDPLWLVPQAIRDEHARDGDPLPRVVRPGPSNPLGAYALELGFHGYLIHGTNRRFGIGMRLTHGCMRLYDEDIRALFAQVPVGTPVRIIDARFLAAWDHGVLYLEAHPPRDASMDDQFTVVEAVLHAAGKSRRLTVREWRRVLEIAARPEGIPVPVTDGGGAKPGT